MLKRVQQALSEARLAAEEASEAYLRSAPREPDGSLSFVNCGSAYVYASQMTAPLRKALKSLNAIDINDRGCWPMFEITGHTKAEGTQSAQANSLVCEAAAEVLKQHFSGEGHFGVRFKDD